MEKLSIGLEVRPLNNWKWKCVEERTFKGYITFKSNCIIEGLIREESDFGDSSNMLYLFGFIADEKYSHVIHPNVIIDKSKFIIIDSNSSKCETFDLNKLNVSTIDWLNFCGDYRVNNGKPNMVDTKYDVMTYIHLKKSRIDDWSELNQELYNYKANLNNNLRIQLTDFINNIESEYKITIINNFLGLFVKNLPDFYNKSLLIDNNYLPDPEDPLEIAKKVVYHCVANRTEFDNILYAYSYTPSEKHLLKKMWRYELKSKRFSKGTFTYLISSVANHIEKQQAEAYMRAKTLKEKEINEYNQFFDKSYAKQCVKSLDK